MNTLPREGRSGETICGETDVGEKVGDVILDDACELRGDVYEQGAVEVIPAQERCVGDRMPSMFTLARPAKECKCSELRLLFELLGSAP